MLGAEASRRTGRLILILEVWAVWTSCVGRSSEPAAQCAPIFRGRDVTSHWDVILRIDGPRRVFLTNLSVCSILRARKWPMGEQMRNCHPFRFSPLYQDMPMFDSPHNLHPIPSPLVRLLSATTVIDRYMSDELTIPWYIYTRSHILPSLFKRTHRLRSSYRLIDNLGASLKIIHEANNLGQLVLHLRCWTHSFTADLKWPMERRTYLPRRGNYIAEVPFTPLTLSSLRSLSRSILIGNYSLPIPIPRLTNKSTKMFISIIFRKSLRTTTTNCLHLNIDILLFFPWMWISLDTKMKLSWALQYD